MLMHEVDDGLHDADATAPGLHIVCQLVTVRRPDIAGPEGHSLLELAGQGVRGDPPHSHGVRAEPVAVAARVADEDGGGKVTGHQCVASPPGGQAAPLVVDPGPVARRPRGLEAADEAARSALPVGVAGLGVVFCDVREHAAGPGVAPRPGPTPCLLGPRGRGGAARDVGRAALPRHRPQRRPRRRPGVGRDPHLRRSRLPCLARIPATCAFVDALC